MNIDAIWCGWMHYVVILWKVPYDYKKFQWISMKSNFNTKSVSIKLMHFEVGLLLFFRTRAQSEYIRVIKWFSDDWINAHIRVTAWMMPFEFTCINRICYNVTNTDRLSVGRTNLLFSMAQSYHLILHTIHSTSEWVIEKRTFMRTCILYLNVLNHVEWQCIKTFDICSIVFSIHRL